jgi:LDH2 family malate/lactate/ureidoglycolate dehydrogenase
MMAAATDLPRFEPDELLDYAAAILRKLDVPALDARTVAECLILADLRGVDSHGLIRLPVYVRRVQANAVKAKPDIQVERRFASVCMVDGDNGLGPVVGLRAMNEAIEIAQTAGFGFVGVRHSNHFGVGAFYVERAIRRGFIGFATSNAPPNMAPFGGKERFLGTNPFAIGVPTGRVKPLLFDASSSVAARGKIIAAAKRNAPIPSGWALDSDGHATIDAKAALNGAVLPFGAAKGSAISFLIDTLCGVLTGAAFALHLNTLENLKAVQNVGHIFAALRTDLFMSSTEFAERIDESIGMLIASPPLPGIPRVLAPGEPELEAESRNHKFGIPIANEVVCDLTDIGNEFGVAFPGAVRRSFV